MDKLIETVKVSIPYIITYLVLILVFAFFVYLYNLKLALILAFIQFTWPFGVAIVLIAEYRYFYVRKKLQHHDYRQSDVFMYDQLYLKELQSLKQKVNDERNRELLNQKEREDYIRLWSHEIKTPLTRMKLMLDDDHQNSNNKLQKQVKIIQSQLDLLLTYERIKSFNSDIHFKEVNLREECNHCLKNLMEMAIDKNLIVQNNLPNVTYLTDEKWLKIVIEQLLMNAIKYSNDNGQIKIELQKNVLKISDNGIGICAEDLPEIFKAGYIGKNTRQNENASGLGLYLIKQICKKMNIGIDIQSVENHGTTVNLSLVSKLIQK